MKNETEKLKLKADDDALSIQYVDLEAIRPLVKNFKLHDRDGIAASLQARGLIDPIGIDEVTNENFDGNGRVEGLLWLKDQKAKPPAKVVVRGEKWFVPCVFGVAFASEAERVAAAAALNKLNQNGGFDSQKEAEILRELLQAGENKATGYSDDEVSALIAQFLPEGGGASGGEESETSRAAKEAGEAENAARTLTLAERFLVPPFSVLDARSGAWQARKRAWLSLGIKSEEGRGGNLLNFSDAARDPAKAYGKKGEEKPEAKPAPTAEEMKRDLEFYRDQKKRGLGAIPNNHDEMLHKYKGEYEKNKGLLGFSDSGNDPEYYRKKQEVEAALGFEISREEFQACFYEGSETLKSGTSIFDPVLCEIAYTWFTPEGARILDPFAGGSVRGIVAAKLKRSYTGVDLREEQVAANRAQAEEILGTDAKTETTAPRWLCGDSVKGQPAEKFDFLFSCPPYYNLEVYSDDPRDLSTAANFAAFAESYHDIIRQAVERLEDNRFACFVVGEVRGKDGIYHNLVGETIAAFEAAGAVYYNEIVLVTAVGSLPIRAGRQFAAARAVGKTHQNVLVFVKGDRKKASAFCGEVLVADFFSSAAPETEAGKSSDASDGLISESDLAAKFEKLEGGEI